MISLSYGHAFLLYLGSILISLLSLWVYSNGKSRKKLQVPASHYLFNCEYCDYHYLADSHLSVHQCPQCHSYNKKS